MSRSLTVAGSVAPESCGDTRASRTHRIDGTRDGAARDAVFPKAGLLERSAEEAVLPGLFGL
jgi:hypothetical protein